MSEQLNVEAERAAPDVYEYGPEGMPRVKRMPDAVLDCIIDHSLFRYLGGALEGEDRDRLHGLMHDTANEALARIDGWPAAAPVVGEVELPALPLPDSDLLGDGRYPVWGDAQVRQAQMDAIAPYAERIRVLEAFLEGEANLAKWAQDRAQQQVQSIGDDKYFWELVEAWVEHGGGNARKKAIIAYIDGRTAGAAEAKPVAWARKWHIDGEQPVKERNANGRMAWLAKFKFKPITPHRIFPDDVPLAAVPSHQQGKEGA